DLEHGAERGLREADRVLAAHVEAVAPEHGVLGDPQVDVEVAGRGAALAGLALALEGLDAAVLGAGGHDDGELAGPAVAVGDVDRLAAAERGILEAELERVAQVAAALPAAAPAEQVVEDVLGGLDHRRQAGGVVGVAPAVVARASLGVGQHGVGVVDLAERLAVAARADVGVVLAGELAERALELGLARGARDR